MPIYYHKKFLTALFIVAKISTVRQWKDFREHPRKNKLFGGVGVGKEEASYKTELGILKGDSKTTLYEDLPTRKSLLLRQFPQMPPTLC